MIISGLSVTRHLWNCSLGWVRRVPASSRNLSNLSRISFPSARNSLLPVSISNSLGKPVSGNEQLPLRHRVSSITEDGNFQRQTTMSRKSSRKITAVRAYDELNESVSKPEETSSKKKGRQATSTGVIADETILAPSREALNSKKRTDKSQSLENGVVKSANAVVNVRSPTKRNSKVEEDGADDRKDIERISVSTEKKASAKPLKAKRKIEVDDGELDSKKVTRFKAKEEKEGKTDGEIQSKNAKKNRKTKQEKEVDADGEVESKNVKQNRKTKQEKEVEADGEVENKNVKQNRKTKQEKEVEADGEVGSKNVKQNRNTKQEKDVEADGEVENKNKKQNRKTKQEKEVEADGEVEIKNVKKKRKTKEEKEADAQPLADRTSVETLKKAMYIGAHVSGAGGVHNSIKNALQIGANSYALFLRSQRKWENPPLAADVRDQFHAFNKEHNYDAAKHVLPHGSYLVNLAQADADKAAQAYEAFVDDLHRCEALGIRLYNFHPGNTGPNNSRPEAIARIASCLNKAHKATKTVVTVLENMAGAGNVIGSAFEDLRDIIALVDDKSRVGVCIDTCHSFAAGYDLRSPEAFKKTIDSFNSIVGMEYLMALHLNDSKAPFQSHRDLHANIGTGFLGLRAFHNVVNFEPFQHLPMVLETPIDKKGADGKMFEDRSMWAAEIKLLEGLIGADPQSKKFRIEEQRLQDLGAEERAKFQKQNDNKVQKTIESMFKGAKGKAKKKKKGEEEENEDIDGECSH